VVRVSLTTVVAHAIRSRKFASSDAAETGSTGQARRKVGSGHSVARLTALLMSLADSSGLNRNETDWLKNSGRVETPKTDLTHAKVAYLPLILAGDVGCQESLDSYRIDWRPFVRAIEGVRCKPEHNAPGLAALLEDSVGPVLHEFEDLPPSVSAGPDSALDASMLLNEGGLRPIGCERFLRMRPNRCSKPRIEAFPDSHLSAPPRSLGSSAGRSREAMLCLRCAGLREESFCDLQELPWLSHCALWSQLPTFLTAQIRLAASPPTRP